MKLVSYNIQYGFGGDGRYDLTRAARVVEGADIIALQEVERHWRRTNLDDQPAILAGLTGDMAERVRSIGADMGEVASDHFPLRVEIDLEMPFSTQRSAQA